MDIINRLYYVTENVYCINNDNSCDANCEVCVKKQITEIIQNYTDAICKKQRENCVEFSNDKVFAELTTLEIVAVKLPQIKHFYKSIMNAPQPSIEEVLK